MSWEKNELTLTIIARFRIQANILRAFYFFAKGAILKINNHGRVLCNVY